MEVLGHPRYPSLHCHIELYKAIGVDGMTSDEEVEDSKGNVTYVSYRKEYLSPEVSRLGEHLDNIHHVNFKPRPYVRRPPILRSVEPVHWIKGLPWNVYNIVLLGRLKDQERQRLGVAMVTYSFTHHMS